MRLLEYDYTISHTPGNKLFTADLLSRKPQQNPAAKGADRDIESTEEESEALTLEQLPASEHMLGKDQAQHPSGHHTEYSGDPMHFSMAFCTWPSTRTQVLRRSGQ
ncbi:hypothetical protein MTO96_004928 [Rhipicephalus appendiculatus]